MSAKRPQNGPKMPFHATERSKNDDFTARKRKWARAEHARYEIAGFHEAVQPDARQDGKRHQNAAKHLRPLARR
jgi:hypothetical protein